MCDGGMLLSRCYRVCVHESVVGKCDPPIVDCHRAKALQQRHSTPHTTSWRPQNYDESTLNGVDRVRERAILVARFHRRRGLQYRFYGHVLEHFFLTHCDVFHVPRLSMKSREPRDNFFQSWLVSKRDRN